MNEYSEAELITGINNQDDLVIRYLYENIGPRVRAYILRLGGSEAEAEDIFQEGIIAAYENVTLGKYQALKQTKFSTYLFQICKYKWYEILKSAHKRKGRAEISYDLKLEDPDMQMVLEDNEKIKMLHTLISRLGKQCIEIIKRFYWAKESLSEIAEALGMAQDSVKNGKYRCMKQLRIAAKDNIYLK